MSVKFPPSDLWVCVGDDGCGIGIGAVQVQMQSKVRRGTEREAIFSSDVMSRFLPQLSRAWNLS